MQEFFPSSKLILEEEKDDFCFGFLRIGNFKFKKITVKKEFNSAEIFGYIFNSNGVGDTTNSKTLDNLITLTITGTYDIPENAFVNCKSLVTINLPNEITSIGDYAFKGCTSLVNMVLPTSLTNLGMNAFQNCTVLLRKRLPYHHYDAQVNQLAYPCFQHHLLPQQMLQHT